MQRKIVGSVKYSLNAIDWTKIFKGAVIAVGGAVLAYATETITKIDFGQYTGIAVAAFSILINAAQKFLTDYSKE